MRLFVTGGSGLVGGNLIRLAAREGAEIFAALHRRSLPPHLPVTSARTDPTDREAAQAAVRAFRSDLRDGWKVSRVFGTTLLLVAMVRWVGVETISR